MKKNGGEKVKQNFGGDNGKHQEQNQKDMDKGSEYSLVFDKSI